LVAAATRIAAQGTRARADHAAAIVGLGELLASRGDGEEACRCWPASRVGRDAAVGHWRGWRGGTGDGDIESRLDALLDRVKDDGARQEFVDLLELLGPDDRARRLPARSSRSRLY